MSAAATPRAPRGRGRLRSAGRLGLLGTLIAAGIGLVAPGPAAAVSDDDWLGIVNTYRAMSGLSPVTGNATWAAEATAHSCYMLQNGITHDETPGRPGYTPGGDVAGNSGNVAVSSQVSAGPRKHIDLWMTGPFHAIGILRHNLAVTAFGGCNDPNGAKWKSGGTLDVLRGLDHSRPRPTTPIVFPGNGVTIPLDRFITESPNPRDMCGWSADDNGVGLPLIAMMPSAVSSATATLTGPSGPIATCVLHVGNVADPLARAILAGDNAVVIVPQDILATGTYKVSVTTNGGSASWSFNVDPAAPLMPGPPPDLRDTAPVTGPARFDPVAPYRHVDTRLRQRAVRLPAGKPTTIRVSNDPSVVAVSANFVAVDPSGPGYVTLYNCTRSVPVVSTIGYSPGDVIANQAIVPLKDGSLCVYSKESTDLVVDVNGTYRTSGGSGFVPISPARLFDSRTGRSRVEPGRELVLRVAGADPGAPRGATAVALNVTAVLPDGPGYARVYPCGAPTAAEISTINFWGGDVRPNTVVVPVSDAGTVCVSTTRQLDLIVDVTGHFTDSGGLDFVPLQPIRLLDTRSPYRELNPFTGGQRLRGGREIAVKIAGTRGVPADAKAVAVNLTLTETSGVSHLTAYPCGRRPSTSNANIVPWQLSSANGAMVKLSSEGTLCLYVQHDVHVVLDVNGVWR